MITATAENTNTQLQREEATAEFYHHYNVGQQCNHHTNPPLTPTSKPST